MNLDILQRQPPPADARLAYGPDPLQFGDLRLPVGEGPHPVAIVIHGGFWRPAYNLDHMGHLCAALTRTGVATWNIEYRRMEQNGGDWRVTTADVLLAANFVSKLDAPINTARVVVIGFLAGGHLALWLASQKQRLSLCGAVSLAGVADLRRAEELQLSNNVTRDFLGADPNYAEASPIERLPSGVPTRLLHGTEDDKVPYEISVRFEKAARAAGDDCRLVTCLGAGHMDIADPLSKEWPAVHASILELLSS